MLCVFSPVRAVVEEVELSRELEIGSSLAILVLPQQILQVQMRKSSTIKTVQGKRITSPSASCMQVSPVGSAGVRRDHARRRRRCLERSR